MPLKPRKWCSRWSAHRHFNEGLERYCDLRNKKTLCDVFRDRRPGKKGTWLALCTFFVKGKGHKRWNATASDKNEALRKADEASTRFLGR